MVNITALFISCAVTDCAETLLCRKSSRVNCQVKVVHYFYDIDRFCAFPAVLSVCTTGAL